MRAPTENPLAAGLPDLAADIISRVRRKRPRVHCLTNAVAQSFTANVLLAAGAAPSMTIAPEEIAEFVGRADALLINLGTLDHERREAAVIAIEAASAEQRPWVLDPVLVDRSRPRAEFAKALIARRPSAVRLNSAEFAAIAGTDYGREALERFAIDGHCVAALTGATDLITDGVRTASIENGDARMAQVTAMGCAGTALAAACLAVEADAWIASCAGLLAFAIAGERAAVSARGPGSFAVEMLDSLANLDGDTLRMRACVR
jgi:hydroxyethylthiazole kinase